MTSVRFLRGMRFSAVLLLLASGLLGKAVPMPEETAAIRHPSASSATGGLSPLLCMRTRAPRQNSSPSPAMTNAPMPNVIAG